MSVEQGYATYKQKRFIEDLSNEIEVDLHKDVEELTFDEAKSLINSLIEVKNNHKPTGQISVTRAIKRVDKIFIRIKW